MRISGLPPGNARPIGGARRPPSANAGILTLPHTVSVHPIDGGHRGEVDSESLLDIKCHINTYGLGISNSLVSPRPNDSPDAITFPSKLSW